MSTSCPTKSITLSQSETSLWDDGGPDGDAFRKSICDSARDHSRALAGRTVEIYSYDGVTLDAVECS